MPHSHKGCVRHDNPTITGSPLTHETRHVFITTRRESNEKNTHGRTERKVSKAGSDRNKGQIYETRGCSMSVVTPSGRCCGQWVLQMVEKQTLRIRYTQILEGRVLKNSRDFIEDWWVLLHPINRDQHMVTSPGGFNLGAMGHPFWRFQLGMLLVT